MKEGTCAVFTSIDGRPVVLDALKSFARKNLSPSSRQTTAGTDEEYSERPYEAVNSAVQVAAATGLLSPLAAKTTRNGATYANGTSTVHLTKNDTGRVNVEVSGYPLDIAG